MGIWFNSLVTFASLSLAWYLLWVHNATFNSSQGKIPERTRRCVVIG